MSAARQSLAIISDPHNIPHGDGEVLRRKSFKDVDMDVCARAAVELVKAGLGYEASSSALTWKGLARELCVPRVNFLE